jgi:hypothetical protein
MVAESAGYLPGMLAILVLEKLGEHRGVAVFDVAAAPDRGLDVR